MTKFQLILELLNLTNGLMESGVDDNNVREIRTYFDDLFTEYEKQAHILHQATSSRGDLELFNQLLANLDEESHNLWLEEKEQKIRSQNKHFSEDEFIRELYKITGVPFDLQEYINLPYGEFDPIEEEETDVTIQRINYPENAQWLFT